VFAEPFNKKAKAVIPSSRAVGVLASEREKQSSSSQSSDKYARHDEYHHAVSAGRRLRVAHLPVQELAIVAIHFVLEPATLR
jgi:hypothetical protein